MLKCPLCKVGRKVGRNTRALLGFVSGQPHTHGHNSRPGCSSVAQRNQSGGAQAVKAFFSVSTVIAYVVVEHALRTDVVWTAADTAAAKHAVDQMSASGGGDTPEGVADAFHAVSSLAWRPSAARSMVRIADAPPHGENQRAVGASLARTHARACDPSTRTRTRARIRSHAHAQTHARTHCAYMCVSTAASRC
jgi:hypothetical protein